MVVMIYAYEDIYCGLHGINTGGVFEVDSVAEAFEVMDSSTELFHTENTVKAFEILWNCEDAVEGIDVY